ncbi:DUF4376 domain-containing protein [Cronobacter sp. EKM101R]|uniref:DUF4376 domain-containing protein n=1 Tax=unclassified Cronobacter TaxID=2649764 RepID=UPI0013EBD6D9|nr:MULTISPECIES: DUF4376 domain-containing protein [unclassified Cronobacter]KAF6596794.1 DUF4376 domain-containing protein [Cronobacter sp. EKM101R]KAF6599045.1 DUF4376 domain-containing protein [Cronobacter sp. EKM102R]
MKIRLIKNPRYLENGNIDCEVFFDGLAQPVPFTAGADDTEATGQQIWRELQSGKWGEPAPFSVTSEMTEAARDEKRREIEAWRAKQEAQPFTFEWGGRVWNGGPDSLARIVPAAMAAKEGASGETLGWGDASNRVVSLTIVQLQDLATAMAQVQMERNADIYRRQRDMKDHLAGLEDLNAIRAFSVE